MRSILMMSALLFVVIPSHSAFKKSTTVSGIAVSAQTADSIGDTSKIMKYEIGYGVPVSKTVLYRGHARYATISSDGQKVAFIKSDNAIAVMGINGGTPAEVVTGLVDNGGYLDWPDGAKAAITLKVAGNCGRSM